MADLTLKIKKLDPRAVLPTRATPGSAGMDLYALLDAPLTILPGQRAGVPTGIAIGLPSPETVGLVYARSGLATKHGLTLSNCVGVIDSDYTGELRVGMINLSDEPYTIEPGERIAQLVIAPVLLPAVEEVAELEKTARGDGGFGSTGRR
ncbi:MAG TPA: dUTP diphosphatase [Firmicutes bacterium]|nr:dUTP diphosphatase [Bacillota bacterium]